MKKIKIELLRKKNFNAINVYEINHKWNQVKNDPRSCERNLCNCVKETWKNFRISTGFEPVTSRYRCEALTNWAMKPLLLGAGHKWQQRGSFFTWLKFLSFKKRCCSLEKYKNFVFESYSQFLKLSSPESLKQRLRKYRKWPTLR